MLPEGWFECEVQDVLQRVYNPVDVDTEGTYQEIGVRSHGRGTFDKPPTSGKSLGNKRVFWVEPDCFVVNIVFAWEQAVARTFEHDRGKIASHRFPMYAPKAEEADLDYITYFFRTPRGKYLLGLASPGGAGRNKTLGQKEFDRLKLVLPVLEEQKRIASILSTWDKAIENVSRLIDVAQRQKMALQQQLLSGRRRLPGFADEWKEVGLQEVAKILVSPVDKKSKDGEIPVRLCNYRDVYHNNRITTSLNFMEATATQKEIDKFSIGLGDVVITKDSETPGDIAVPAYVSQDLNGVVCGYHLAILRPNASRLDGEFLSHLLSTHKMKYYFFTLATGATRFGLSIAAIKKAHLKVPSLPEQSAISSILTCADAKIESYSKKRQLLVNEKKALTQQLLTGKRRVRLEDAHAKAATG